MRKLTKIFLVASAIIFISFFACFYYIIFIAWEDRADHNGVGWRQFRTSLEQQLEQSEFTPEKVSSYEGSVWLGELISGNKSIEFGAFTRADFDDARDLNTLRRANIYQINRKQIYCEDDFGHDSIASISLFKIPFSNPSMVDTSSIPEILSRYDEISKFVLHYEIETYIVENGKPIGMPDWLYVSTDHSDYCSESHEMHFIKCELGNASKLN